MRRLHSLRLVESQVSSKIMTTRQTYNHTIQNEKYAIRKADNIGKNSKGRIGKNKSQAFVIFTFKTQKQCIYVEVDNHILSSLNTILTQKKINSTTIIQTNNNNIKLL